VVGRVGIEPTTKGL